MVIFGFPSFGIVRKVLVRHVWKVVGAKLTLDSERGAPAPKLLHKL